MTIETIFPNIKSWRNRKHYYNLELPKRDPQTGAVIIKKPEIIIEEPPVTFGTVRASFEINKNGHERLRRDIVLEVELDSGFEAKVLYNGIENNIAVGCRVKIENIKVKDGIQKVVTILKKIEDKIIFPISSDREKVPEETMSSK